MVIPGKLNTGSCSWHGSTGPLRRHSGRRKPCKSMGPSVPGKSPPFLLASMTWEIRSLKGVMSTELSSGWAFSSEIATGTCFFCIMNMWAMQPTNLKSCCNRKSDDIRNTICCKNCSASVCTYVGSGYIQRTSSVRPSSLGVHIRMSVTTPQDRKCSQAAEDKGPSTSMSDWDDWVCQLG